MSSDQELDTTQGGQPSDVPGGHPARPVFVEMDWIYVVDDEWTLNGIPIEWIPHFDSEVETDG